MIQLMTIPQTKTVLDMWFDKLDKLNEDTQAVKDYKETLEEVIGHANVYVYLDANDIKAAAIIHEGYYLSDLIYQDKEIAIELIEEIKKRYDELQADVHVDDKLNEVMAATGFKFLGKSQHDLFSYEENQYEYLAQE